LNQEPKHMTSFYDRHPRLVTGLQILYGIAILGFIAAHTAIVLQQCTGTWAECLLG